MTKSEARCEHFHATQEETREQLKGGRPPKAKAPGAETTTWGGKPRTEENQNAMKETHEEGEAKNRRTTEHAEQKL